MNRQYDQLTASLAGLKGDSAARMRGVVDALWDALHTVGVSWVGFYVHEAGQGLILGPHRDKSACSPIGLHGACGQAFRSKEPLVVQDVAELGEEYIACDPRDRSEIVLPLLDASGTCWGVLDLDSHESGAFDRSDVAGLQSVLQAARLSRPA